MFDTYCVSRWKLCTPIFSNNRIITFYCVKDECFLCVFFTDYLASLSSQALNSLWYIEQIQFTLSCFCSKIDHRLRQNLVRKKCGSKKLLLNRVKDFTFSMRTKFSKLYIIVGYVKQRKHFCMMSAMRL